MLAQVRQAPDSVSGYGSEYPVGTDSRPIIPLGSLLLHFRGCATQQFTPAKLGRRKFTFNISESLLLITGGANNDFCEINQSVIVPKDEMVTKLNIQNLWSYGTQAVRIRSLKFTECLNQASLHKKRSLLSFTNLN